MKRNIKVGQIIKWNNTLAMPLIHDLYRVYFVYEQHEEGQRLVTDEKGAPVLQEGRTMDKYHEAHKALMGKSVKVEI